MNRFASLVMALLIPMTLLLAGCASTAEGDSSVSELPDFAYRSADAAQGYQIAAREKELLARLPCYCGCGQDPQYKNLLDCFMDSEGTPRAHAANCQICLEEAEDAARWKGEGLTARQIRDRIDAQYEGRGKPTDTPPILE